ncbi:PPC domain-containing protein [Dankookia sp. GCM10030260]|uniref:PPC domain-containing protein n=1 Tax=Dankookia sp. GCM10030260 TaxID=3273390 RepID=UPI0036D34DBE
MAKTKDGEFHTAASLDSPDDVDVWRVNLHAGDTVTISTDNEDDFNPDTVLALFDHKGNILAVDDDSGGAFQSLITYDVTETGNYFFAVTSFANFPSGGDKFPDGPSYPGFGGSTGSYGLDLVIA